MQQTLRKLFNQEKRQTEVTADKAVDVRVKREKQRTISKNCRFTRSEICLINAAVTKADISFSNLLRKSVLMVASEIVQRKIPTITQQTT